MRPVSSSVTPGDESYVVPQKSGHVRPYVQHGKLPIGGFLPPPKQFITVDNLTLNI